MEWQFSAALHFQSWSGDGKSRECCRDWQAYSSIQNKREVISEGVLQKGFCLFQGLLAGVSRWLQALFGCRCYTFDWKMERTASSSFCSWWTQLAIPSCIWCGGGRVWGKLGLVSAAVAQHYRHTPRFSYTHRCLQGFRECSGNCIPWSGA